jgi:hypothetical protein
MFGIKSKFFSGVSAFAFAISPNLVLAQGTIPPAPVFANVAQSVPSLAAMRALTSANLSKAPFVIREGYYAAGDAPPVKFVWKSSCPGVADNRGLYVGLNEGGGGCLSSVADPNNRDLRNWGAINDSATNTCGTDNSAATQAAFTALGVGANLYNDGWSCLKSTVVVSASNAGVKCKGSIGGAAGHHDYALPEFVGPAGFVGYTYGGTLFKYQTATSQSLHGNFMECTLSGNTINPTFGQAAIGVQAYSIRNGHWRIAGGHFQTAIFDAEIDPNLSAGFALGTADAAGSSGNEYWLYMDQSLQFDQNGFICNGTATWDCSQDNFYIVYGVWSGAGAMMVLNGADSENIFNISGYNNQAGDPGGTHGCGLKLSAANNIDTARNNYINFAGFSNAPCGVYAEGTEGGKSTPSGPNNVYQLDILDSAVGPVVGPGAKLNWGTYNTPIGLNYYTQNGVKTSQRTSNGIITNSGNSTSIAALGSQAFVFNTAWSTLVTPGAQLYFPTGCMNWNVAPNSAVPWHVACVVAGTTTTFTIFNDSTTTAAFFSYSVTGY